MVRDTVGGCEGTIVFDADTKDKEYQLSDGYDLPANTTRKLGRSITAFTLVVYHCFHLLATRTASGLRMTVCFLAQSYWTQVPLQK